MLKLDLCVGGFCVCWGFFEWEVSVEEKSKVVEEEWESGWYLLSAEERQLHYI